MASKQTEANKLRTPWDTILGTKSHVRILRVLDRTRESMTVRELARTRVLAICLEQPALREVFGVGRVVPHARELSNGFVDVVESPARELGRAGCNVVVPVGESVLPEMRLADHGRFIPGLL